MGFTIQANVHTSISCANLLKVHMSAFVLEAKAKDKIAASQQTLKGQFIQITNVFYSLRY